MVRSGCRDSAGWNRVGHTDGMIARWSTGTIFQKKCAAFLGSVWAASAPALSAAESQLLPVQRMHQLSISQVVQRILRLLKEVVLALTRL